MDIQENLKLNLQFFADDNPDEPENPTKDKEPDNDGNQSGKDESKDEQPIYTEARFQQELTRRLKQKDKEKQDAIKEAEKLAKMNKDQKAEYEMQKLREENQKLRDKETMNEMRNEARSMFLANDITADDDLLKFVVTTEAETTKENVESFTNILNKMVQDKVKASLRNGTPKNVNTSGMTRQDIMNIKDDTQRQMAIAQNRHLFN